MSAPVPFPVAAGACRQDPRRESSRHTPCAVRRSRHTPCAVAKRGRPMACHTGSRPAAHGVSRPEASGTRSVPATGCRQAIASEGNVRDTPHGPVALGLFLDRPPQRRQFRARFFGLRWNHPQVRPEKPGRAGQAPSRAAANSAGDLGGCSHLRQTGSWVRKGWKHQCAQRLAPRENAAEREIRRIVSRPGVRPGSILPALAQQRGRGSGVLFGRRLLHMANALGRKRLPTPFSAAHEATQTRIPI